MGWVGEVLAHATRNEVDGTAFTIIKSRIVKIIHAFWKPIARPPSGVWNIVECIQPVPLAAQAHSRAPIALSPVKP